jgi:hypothetical protein
MASYCPNNWVSNSPSKAVVETTSWDNLGNFDLYGLSFINQKLCRINCLIPKEVIN